MYIVAFTNPRSVAEAKQVSYQGRLRTLGFLVAPTEFEAVKQARSYLDKHFDGTKLSVYRVDTSIHSGIYDSPYEKVMTIYWNMSEAEITECRHWSLLEIKNMVSGKDIGEIKIAC